MTAKLTNYDAEKCCNFDETPMYPWKTRGRVIIEKSDRGNVTWKEKIVVHASHLVQSYNFQKKKLGFKPFFVVQVKQTRWTTVKYKGNDYEMLRKSNRAI